MNWKREARIFFVLMIPALWITAGLIVLTVIDGRVDQSLAGIAAAAAGMALFVWTFQFFVRFTWRSLR